MNKAISLIVVTLLVGCTNYQPIIPEGYTGGISTISDTFIQVGRGEAQFFYVESVNGVPVRNALDTTAEASHNKGVVIYPSGAIRGIPSELLKIVVTGENYHAAPVLQFFDSKNSYEIKEEIEFQPKKGIDYLVKGRLEKNYHAIWIEDISGNIVSSITAYENKNKKLITSNELTGYSLPKNERQIFLQIQGGEASDIIVKKLGSPDDIEQLNAKSLFSVAQTIYTYDDLGEIYFTKNFKKLFVKKIVPNRENNNIELKDQLLSNDPIFLRELGMNYYRLADIPESELDQIAGKIWELKDSEDSYMVDALSWFCKVLGKSNNEKYREILQSLMSQDVSNKLKRYAKSSLKNLPGN